MKEIRLTAESINTFLQKKTEAGNKPETITEYRRILLALDAARYCNAKGNIAAMEDIYAVRRYFGGKNH